MTPDQAADLAARTLAAIDALDGIYWPEVIHAADRERVASDLRAIERAEEGLRGHGERFCSHCPDARRWTEARDEAWASLRRTAALYGVTEWDGTFTPAQQALHDEVEANTEDLLAALARAEYLEDEK